MYSRWVPVILTLALSASSVLLAQQSPDSIKDSVINRQEGDEVLREILNEIRAVRQLLERESRPAGRGQPLPMPEIPQTGKLRVEGGYFLGSNNAPLTVVEFTDYQCSYCRVFESTTFAEIRKKYVDTGKVRFVIRDFPLVNIHPESMRAAEAAHCAGDQGKFWPMHDAIFNDQSNLGWSGLIKLAERLKLHMGAFRACLASEKYKLDIQRDQEAASTLQINATPSFPIGKMLGQELSGAILVGAPPVSVFETKLREAETTR